MEAGGEGVKTFGRWRRDGVDVVEYGECLVLSCFGLLFLFFFVLVFVSVSVLFSSCLASSCLVLFLFCLVLPFVWSCLGVV